MPDSNLSQTLYTTAEAYLSLGYSVIPVWGEADPARPKVAGVEWSLYQRRRPTTAEIHKWFLDDTFSGLAIITGSISRLAVLDFDTPEGFRNFSLQHPDLVKHQVIQTRRGYHIYFHLPPHLHLPSRKGQGIDLLSTGRYVIARPTSIDGHVYKLIRGGQPKPLTQFDVDSINRFIDEKASLIAVSTPKREFRAFSLDSDSIEQSRRQPQTPLESAYELKDAYHRLIEKGSGRNDALFQVSLKARDTGYSIDTVMVALADLHVFQPNAAVHRSETPAQRYLEAKRTVQSAFSRPSRIIRKVPTVAGTQLPNTAREQLFKLGETKVVRVIEGLRLKGINPGDVFTASQAVELLKGIVGRDSVYGALKATSEVRPERFTHLNPSPAPLTTANAATNTKTDTTKCFIGRAEKSGISLNHRPTIRYIMPNNDDLCRCLGVKSSHSDPITVEDLATAKQTRMAAQREFIRRCPGIYPRCWLARRLGVDCDTLDTYNREIEGLHSRPCFWEQPVYWSNLRAVPDGIEVSGAVLVDETGKRYPAQRKIAALLLGKSRRVIYKRQDANYYWYGEDTPYKAAKFEPNFQERRTEVQQQPTKKFFRLIPHTQVRLPISTTGNVATLQPLPIKDIKSNPESKQTSSTNYRKPLKDYGQESCAMRVYNALNTNMTSQADQISQATVRRLVHKHGTRAVEDALRLVSVRHNVNSRVGFLITVLRSQCTTHLRQIEMKSHRKHEHRGCRTASS